MDTGTQMETKAPLTREERRAKRQARRDHQRLVNVERAAAMRKARKAWEAGANGAGKGVAARFNVGCSGWFYWHWRGEFYPAAMPANKWFGYYAGRFKTVELNAPFYSWPSSDTVRTWRRQSGRRKFVYTVKVCELITHIKRFDGCKTLIRDFCHIADLLGPQMGCFLFQLPPSFHFSPARLKRVVNSLDPARRNVVEFRHRSWWNEQVYDAFRASGTIFCSCSGPRLPDELVKTADEIYIRFHGTKQWYRHDYSKAELAIWAERAKGCLPARVWAYFNNDRDGHAIGNAREFLRQLELSIKSEVTCRGSSGSYFRPV